MGWTSYHATHYRNGKVDRKAECDAYFMEGLNAGWYRIVRSTLVGSVYYAAVQRLKRYTDQEDENGNRLTEDVPEDERETWPPYSLLGPTAEIIIISTIKIWMRRAGQVRLNAPSRS